MGPTKYIIIAVVIIIICVILGLYVVDKKLKKIIRGIQRS